MTIPLLSAVLFYDYHKSLPKYVFLEMCPANLLDSKGSSAVNILKKVA